MPNKKKRSKIKKKTSRKKRGKSRKKSKRKIKTKNKAKIKESSNQELIFKPTPEWVRSGLANRSQYYNKYN